MSSDRAKVATDASPGSERRLSIKHAALSKTSNPLRDPKPDSLKPVPWEALRPNNRVQSSLAGVDVSFGRIPPLGPLEHLPEDVKQEVDGHSDVVGDEVVDREAACDGIEALE